MWRASGPSDDLERPATRAQTILIILVNVFLFVGGGGGKAVWRGRKEHDSGAGTNWSCSGLVPTGSSCGGIGETEEVGLGVGHRESKIAVRGILWGKLSLGDNESRMQRGEVRYSCTATSTTTAASTAICAA